MRGVMDEKLPNDSEILYDFVAKAGRLVGEKYSMSPCGIGGGSDEEGIYSMSIRLDRRSSYLSEDQSRHLLIQYLNDFLDKVNKDCALRPYLKNYPFNVKQLDVAIFNHSSNGYDVFSPWIGTISFHGGKIGYFIYDETDVFRYKSKKYETYDEAVAILAGEKQKVAADAKPVP